MSARLRRHLGPSLARRLVTALSLAFFLVLAVLMALDYREFRDMAARRVFLQAYVPVLTRALGDAGDGEAALIVAATELQLNHFRHTSGLDGIDGVLFGVQSVPTGRTVYASPLLGGQALPDGAGGEAPVRVAGRAYWSARLDTPRWRVAVFEPVPEDASLLRWLAHQNLASMLVAFPLVLLPLWLAVRGGLRPLRGLAERVMARHPSDLSALGLDLRYAELTPLVAAFDELLRKARFGMARERAFVQDAAHELRTPLAVVAAQAHALTVAASPEAQREAKASLERAVARASHLVHQLLSLARLDDAALTRHAEDVNLVEVVRQALIAAADTAAKRGMEISLDSPERLPGRVDVASFHTIVDNLLQNALAYCPDGARIAVSLTAPGSRVRLAVLDDGPGIAPEHAERVFERFHRVQQTANASGAGLGLAIVRQAARAMGGSVTLGPGLEGRGAGFTLDVPVVASP